MGYANDACMSNGGSFTKQQAARMRCNINEYLTSWIQGNHLSRSIPHLIDDTPCSTDRDCSDGTDCTTDTCVSGVCLHSDACVGTNCAPGRCANGQCVFGTCSDHLVRIHSFFAHIP